MQSSASPRIAPFPGPTAHAWKSLSSFLSVAVTHIDLVPSSMPDRHHSAHGKNDSNNGAATRSRALQARQTMELKQELEEDLKAFIRDKNWDYRTKLLAIFGLTRKTEPRRHPFQKEVKLALEKDLENFFLEKTSAVILNERYLQVRAVLLHQLAEDKEVKIELPLSIKKVEQAIKQHVFEGQTHFQEEELQRHILYLKLWTAVFSGQMSIESRQLNEMYQRNAVYVRCGPIRGENPNAFKWLSALVLFADSEYLGSEEESRTYQLYTGAANDRGGHPKTDPIARNLWRSVPAFLARSDGELEKNWEELRQRESNIRECRRISDLKLKLGYKLTPSEVKYGRQVASREGNSDQHMTSISTYDRTRFLLPEEEYTNASVCPTPPFFSRNGRLWVASQGPFDNHKGLYDKGASREKAPQWFLTDDCVHPFLATLLTPPTSPSFENNDKLIGQIIGLASPGDGAFARKSLANWVPKVVGKTRQFHKARGSPEDIIKVTLLDQNVELEHNSKGWNEYHLRVERGHSHPNEVWLFDYPSWGDGSVPEDKSKFLAFLKRVLEGPGSDRPALVHCLAGVGRTGTFIVIAVIAVQVLACLFYKLKEADLFHELKEENLFRKLKEADEKLEELTRMTFNEINQEPEDRKDPFKNEKLSEFICSDPVALVIIWLRECRMDMVQRESQYKFIYEALQELWTMWINDDSTLPACCCHQLHSEGESCNLCRNP
ncbi:phosphatases II [Meredithblackwellia eburnea MCA 4105]